jgi:hypothetical protein
MSDLLNRNLDLDLPTEGEYTPLRLPRSGQAEAGLGALAESDGPGPCLEDRDILGSGYAGLVYRCSSVFIRGS